jgi:hypothetical protein
LFLLKYLASSKGFVVFDGSACSIFHEDNRGTVGLINEEKIDSLFRKRPQRIAAAPGGKYFVSQGTSGIRKSGGLLFIIIDNK